MTLSMPKLCSRMRGVVSLTPRPLISMTPGVSSLIGSERPAVHYQPMRFVSSAAHSECGIRRGLIGWTDLELAASAGNLSEIKTLIARGADPRAANENGQTALHFAAVNGHPGAVELLVEEGVDLNAEDTCGRIPLVLAVQQKQKDAVEALIRYKPSISTEQLLKAVQLAHNNGDEEILSILRSPDVHVNADPDDQEYHCMGVHIEGNTRAPWEQADAHAPIESACDESTVASGDRRNFTIQQNGGGQEALYRATPKSDNFDIASLEEERRGLFSTLNSGQDLSSAEKAGLHNSLTAVGRRMHDIESLIESSIFGQLDRMEDILHDSVGTSTLKVDSTDELGWSALHWAAYKGHSNIVDLLLEHGANTTKLTTREGASPLICAVARQDCDSTARLDIIRALLKHGAQPNGQDGDGETPLHFAVSFLEYDVAQVLLENGADPTIRTHYSITVGDNNFAAGSTPLHYAHQLGAENLIRLIASYAGSSDNSDWQFSYRTNLCDVNMMRDSNGHTPVQLHPRWPCYMI